MKKLSLISISLLIVFTACKEKSDDSNNTGWSAEDQTFYNNVIALQDMAGENWATWSQTMDSLEAISKLQKFFQDDTSVSFATIGNQGIAVQYKNGMRGGIFLNPQDEPEGGKLKMGYRPEPPNYPGNVKSLVNKKSAVLINPSYWERSVYANPLINHYRNVCFPRIGFDFPIAYLNWTGTLDIFSQLDGYGIIHIYTHGWAWPQETDIQDVYLKTGETANDNSTSKYGDDIKNGNILISYAKASSTESANIYYINYKFITAHNDFSKDTVLFYGGFCYSFLGSWDQLYKKFAKGAYFGFDWWVRTDRNVNWASSLVDSLCDTLRSPAFNAEQWISGPIPAKSYYENEDNKTVHIQYVGDADLTLWKESGTVETSPITDITPKTATGGGNVKSDGGFPVTQRGVCWGTSSNPTATGSHTTDGSGTGSFTSNITGLTPSTPYYVRAYATNSKGTMYGKEVSFTTTAGACPGIPTVSYGGTTYNTVQIGTQCWLKENLNIGTMITGATTSTNNGIIEKYCYNNDESNCAVYGGLYQWDEMMNYVTTEGVQGICPTDWHIPTLTEWTMLTAYLGDSIAGGKMKETGLTHWAPPNYRASNESGFSGLPGGLRNNDGLFYHITNMGHFWSSTPSTSPDPNSAQSWYLDYNSKFAIRFSAYNDYGYSVRCVKD